MEKKKNNTYMLIIAVCIVACVAAVIGFVAYQNANEKKGNNTGEKDPAIVEPQKEPEEPVVEPQEVEDIIGSSDEWINEKTDITDYIKENKACFNKLSVLKNPETDKQDVNSLSEYVLSKNSDYSSNDIKAFKESYDPSYGDSKFVYNFYDCNGDTDRANCLGTSAAKVNGEWVIDYFTSGAMYPEMQLLEKIATEYCK